MSGGIVMNMMGGSGELWTYASPQYYLASGGQQLHPGQRLKRPTVPDWASEGPGARPSGLMEGLTS